MELNSLKVLICDDSSLIRRKLKESLFKYGCTKVFEASDGQSAVDIYIKNKPHLVFMDIVMPVKDGITALSEIIKFDKNAKVIISSSSGTKTLLKKALESGACEFIQKPFADMKIESVLKEFKKEVQ
ncbi:response regulator [Clostridium sp. P21]|uniref:Stage 0 sporulation protein A homolog n=1 Tax=Clostridium muellerianum TaxID=2716538 RepID=A0A7Y0HLE7_9CLOT|nr:response regulator [Clostridium muellerianum]NMM61829.1 response regulator [Clostridium muellerianum]